MGILGLVELDQFGCLLGSDDPGGFIVRFPDKGRQYYFSFRVHARQASTYRIVIKLIKRIIAVVTLMVPLWGG